MDQSNFICHNIPTNGRPKKNRNKRFYCKKFHLAFLLTTKTFAGNCEGNYGESNVWCKTDGEKEDRGPNGDVRIEGKVVQMAKANGMR